MYPDNHLRFPSKTPVFRNPIGRPRKHQRSARIGVGMATLLAWLVLTAIPCLAQSDSGNAQPQQNQQQDQVPPAAGGPTGEGGPIAVPKKSTNDEPPPPPKPK